MKTNLPSISKSRALIMSALVLSPVIALAQSYPSGAPAQTQPNQTQPMQGATAGMQDSNASGESAQAMKDKMFLRKAAQGGMAEVKFGQLAAQKGSDDDVKSFGQKMVDDHTKLNNDMTPIADTMGVRLPKNLDKKDQAEYDKLNGLSGTDFDKEYLSYMVKDHHKDLREFREEASSTTDPTLKQAVSNGATVIKQHTMMVDKLARDKGVSMPQRGADKPAAPTP